ncbi:hypothetical protein M441DRAFT_207825 [Trichoderma asperellum CBS 433.97]|uniref:DUF7025 domain-containing protein n=1 Tax=Trichoderma asperellum (strain ATCC 204424 / CBS 433.97 / NBRC 101777) TaxID=1042311 RepID=A0A2T3ZMH4_TRIA4|nr:hypothetical protein M441DRAFT_207825 [Trichoderma asperellum CBS 433.97]PTB46009.1 hypothetical protein M441DRAFT_207825 [Trichoderma asperellum CBS 433.97]
MASPLMEYMPRSQRLKSPGDERLLLRASSRENSHEGSRDSSVHLESSRKRIAERTTIGGINMIEIRSKYLLDAIKKVNKHPPLQPTKDYFTEQAPYPTLFHHMDDVKREIAQMNSEEADDHLKILHSAIDYIDPIWNERREENFTNDLVSYGMIWKLFRPGDLVLRKDDIGNLWLFVLIKTAYSMFQSKEEEKKKVIFETWYLTWKKLIAILPGSTLCLVAANFLVNGRSNRFLFIQFGIKKT